MTDPSHAQGGEQAASDGSRLPVPAQRTVPARGEVVGFPGGWLERLSSRPLAGPALAAAGGFLVGFATFLTARILRGRGGLGFASRRRRRRLERQIESSRSFLVDVHVLRR